MFINFLWDCSKFKEQQCIRNKIRCHVSEVLQLMYNKIGKKSEVLLTKFLDFLTFDGNIFDAVKSYETMIVSK